LSGLRTENIQAVYPQELSDLEMRLLGPRQHRSLLNTFPFNTESISVDRLGVAGDSFQEYGKSSTSNIGVARSPVRASLVRQQDEDVESSTDVTTDSTDDDADPTVDSFPTTVTVITPAPTAVPTVPAVPDPAENEVVNIATIDAAIVGESGRKCIEKVIMVEETVYEEVLECDHSYDKRCHTSYTTTFEAQQEEECTENYRKNCFIAYEKIAFNTTVKVCKNSLVKDCSVLSGPELCRTEYESECATRQHEHEVEDDVVSCETFQDEKCEDVTQGYTTQTKCQKWPREECTVTKQMVKKYSPVTSCKKVPMKLCAPAGCGFKQSGEICHDKVETIVQDKPSEECSIEPQRVCKHVTKLVPRLSPMEECVDVPKEICSRSLKNPRKVKKPIVKKWCYVPSKESGLT